MFELLLLLYCTAVGLAAAGVASTFWQMITAKPVAFRFPSQKMSAIILTGLSFALVGPYIVARGALRSWFVERRPPVWLFGGIALALIWSACSGIVVLDLALTVRNTVA